MKVPLTNVPLEDCFQGDRPVRVDHGSHYSVLVFTQAQYDYIMEQGYLVLCQETAHKLGADLGKAGN